MITIGSKHDKYTSPDKKTANSIFEITFGLQHKSEAGLLLHIDSATPVQSLYF